MNNQDSSSPAVAQSEPVSQAEPAAATSVTSAVPADEPAQAETAELPQAAVSAPASPSVIQRISESLAGADAQPLDPSSVITNETPMLPDHPFKFEPSLTNPLGQMCAVDGCPFTEIAHPLAQKGDVEDCLSEAGHRALEQAVQFVSEHAQETISSVLREDASDNGEPHEDELARMVDEGGPCPESSRIAPGFYRRPQASGGSEKPTGLSEETKDKLRHLADQFENAAAEAEVKGDTPSFEKRLADLEEGLAELRLIASHHGLRGPQA